MDADLQTARNETPPFLVKVFCRTGAFHRPDEFASRALPPHLPIYTWDSCTLTELTHLIADASTAADADLLPSPSIGTRLAYRLCFPDGRTGRFTTKDLGSVVIGGGGPGAEDDNANAAAEAASTLSDARFVVGDYISVAILPPLPSGAVAPVASVARAGRLDREGPPVAGGRRENGAGRGGRGGRGGGREFGGVGARGPEVVPMGEWRRGERLPEGPPRSRGRGRPSRW